ncbi:nucleotidyltransferase family protein [Candidatus Omnitrophota bacterium]
MSVLVAKATEVDDNENALFLKELKEILSSFHLHEIDAIPLKGADLAFFVYSDSALRAMTDLDILIHKDDLPRIEEALVSLGYLMHPHYRQVLDLPVSPYLNTIVAKKLTFPHISLHFHWHILNHSFYPGYGYISDFAIQKIWQDAQDDMLDEVKVIRMAPHHMLLHLSLHHLRHYYAQPALITDIAAVLTRYENEIDWKAVFRDAERYNLCKPLYYALYLVKNRLGILLPPVAEGFVQQMEITSKEQQFLDSVMNGKPSEKLSFYAFLSMNKGMWNKMRFLLRTMYAPRRFRAQLKDLHGFDSGLQYNLRRIRRIIAFLFHSLFKR